MSVLLNYTCFYEPCCKSITKLTGTIHDGSIRHVHISLVLALYHLAKMHFKSFPDAYDERRAREIIVLFGTCRARLLVIIVVLSWLSSAALEIHVGLFQERSILFIYKPLGNLIVLSFLITRRGYVV